MRKYIRPIRTLYIGLFAALLLMPRARAYIDPATTSYIIQIVAAFFITLGVLFTALSARARLFFVKIKMKFLEEHYRRKAAKASPRTAVVKEIEKTTFAGRLWPAAIASFAFAFTFVIYGCFDLFFANSGLMPFVFRDIWLPLTAVGLGVFVLLALVIALTRGVVYEFLFSLLAGFVIAGYIQGNFINPNLGQLTGDAIPWENYKWHMLLNTLIWAVIVALPFVTKRFSRIAWKAFCTGGTALLIAIQGIALIVTLAGSDASALRPANEFLSTKGIYEFSEKNNIIVFILDRLDENYIKEILREDPNYFDDFDGFTRYSNNMTYYCRTYPSVVNMLTGHVTFYDEYASDFVGRAYESGTLFKDLMAKDYKIKLYMDSHYTYTDIAQISDIADNCIEGEISVKARSLTENFLYLSAFRYMPFAAKPSFFLTTSDFADKVEQKLIPAPYLTDDYAYYRAMKKEGLSADMEENNFIYVHLNGSHAPLNLNENVERVPADQTSTKQQTMGCFNIAREMMNQMKELGIYEDATIIITGDHGKSTDWYPLDKPVLVGLFVKRSGEAHTPLKTSSAPVNSDNLRGSIAAAAGFYPKGTNPDADFGDFAGTGAVTQYARPYWDVPEDDEVVRKFYYRINGSDGNYGYLEEFDVRGDGSKFRNWEKIREIKILYPHG